MKTILYIVPYFGKLPDLFPVWLHSCGNNPTIDWLIFTDDVRKFDYPGNVRVVYTSFEQTKERFQSLFDFPINMSEPYRLCDFKITYGLAYAEYVKGYDFWGFCDIDLIWGDIRRFLTDDVLSGYDKIGYQGHSTLFRNNGRNNSLFREKIGDESVYPAFRADRNQFTDENFIIRLCDYLNIQTYRENTFANLSPFVHNFKLDILAPGDDRADNRRFIFRYDSGRLCRLSASGDKVREREFMYVHFLKRDMTVEIPDDEDRYLVIPNRLISIAETDSLGGVDARYIRRADAPHTLRFFIRHFLENAHKLNFRTVIPILRTKIRGYYDLYINH